MWGSKEGLIIPVCVGGNPLDLRRWWWRVREAPPIKLGVVQHSDQDGDDDDFDVVDDDGGGSGSSMDDVDGY